MTSEDEPNATVRVLDLFAGAGGLSEGLRQAGFFRTVQAVEMDPEAAATYSLNHPEADVFVGPIQEWLAQGKVPPVDVIIGGPPCQGFSQLGKQDVEDERNALWREYAKTIVLARPGYFLVENVAAFLRSPQFEQFSAEFEERGSLCEYRFSESSASAFRASAQAESPYPEILPILPRCRHDHPLEADPPPHPGRFTGDGVV